MIVVLAPAMLLLTACGSAQINVGEGPTGTLSHPLLKKCPGAQIELTVTEVPAGGGTGKSATVSNFVVAGSIKFRNSDLKELNLRGLVRLKIKIKSIPDGPGAAGCLLELDQVLMTVEITLTQLGNDEYGVDLDEFK